MNSEATLSFWAIWRWPLVLGLVTLAGLIGALFSAEGPGDWLAGICLWLPVLVACWYGLLPTANTQDSD